MVETKARGSSMFTKGKLKGGFLGQDVKMKLFWF